MRRLLAWAAAGLMLISLVVAGVALYHVAQLPPAAEREAQQSLFKYHFRIQRLLSVVALACLTAGLFAVVLSRWDRTVALMKRAWLAVSHPMNLAIYRIVLFATILFNLDNDSGYEQIKFFAGLPRELFHPPTGMEHILPWLPINPTLAVWTLTLMYFFSFTAMIGFFSRTSAWLVVGFGLYATGIPQYFGQTNHFHHMFWFAAVIAASRCGDYLSVDAVLAARRRADRGSTEPPAPAWGYALPLRFIWVLLGICYFFPGLWKYWVSGLAWAWSDNFKQLMEWKWINLNIQWDNPNSWKPLFRLDQWPLFYRLSAFIAIVFELSFIFLIFFPRGKYIAILMGLGFHRMTWYIMRIPFYTLQTSYVALIEWDRFFGWLGRKLRPGMTFAYDAADRSVRRSVATLRALDLIGNVRYVETGAAEVGARATFADGREVSGVAAYRALAARNPVLWLVWPLVYLLPAPQGGAGLGAPAREAAPEAQATEPPEASLGYATPSTAAAWRGPRVWPAVLCFAIVFTPNLYLGLKRQYHGWPFACYPLFEKMREHVKPDFDVVALRADGTAIGWNERALMDKMTKPRYATMARRVREKLERDNNPVPAHAFWAVLVRENPQLAEAKRVQFWVHQSYSAVELRHAKPARSVRAEAIVTEDGRLVPVEGLTTVSTSEDQDD